MTDRIKVGKNVWINELLTNEILVAAVLGWFFAQVIKFLLVIIEDKRINFERLVGSGGMPSSHSSFVIALTVSVAINEGLSSVYFAICVVFSFIVMYDASGVRRETGKQAVLLNELVENLGHEKLEITGERLKELVGHSHLEVIAGAALGVVIGVITHYIF